MAEPSGPAVAAIRAKQAVLADRQRTAAEADQLLAEVLQRGYAGTVAARRRLDTIAAEIAACVQHQAGFAVDTALGAREMQKLLISKQREAIELLAATQRDAAAEQALLESLPARYPHAANTFRR